MECKTINNERQRHRKHNKLLNNNNNNNKKTYSLLGIKQTTRYKPLIPSANDIINDVVEEIQIIKKLFFIETRSSQ